MSSSIQIARFKGQNTVSAKIKTLIHLILKDLMSNGAQLSIKKALKIAAHPIL